MINYPKCAPRLFLCLAVLFLGGCAVSTGESITGGAPLQTSETETTAPVPGNLPTTVAILPFQNGTGSDFAYEVVRRTIANHFTTTNYRWLHWRDVDRRLRLAGVESPAQLQRLSNQEIAGILSVDGLIHGNITHYNKTFAGVYAQIAVGVELSFVNSADDVLWVARDVQRSHAGGVATSPVGLILNALAAARHLRGELNLYRAADDIGRYLAKELPAPKVLSQRRRPTIVNVVHSGAGQVLKYGDRLEIGIEGDPGMTAAATVDELGVIDLREQSPGQYVGSTPIPNSLNLDSVVVTGRLQDDFGQTVSWISPYGLLRVDNQPPNAVQSLHAESADSRVVLSWSAGMEQDVEGYRVAISETLTGDVTTVLDSQDARIVVDGLVNFKTAYASVTALDAAGNISEPVSIPVVAAPDSRFGSAEPLARTLPAVINGVVKLVPTPDPYYMRSNSRVATGATLLIAPGVKLNVSPGATLTVMGEVVSFASSNEPFVVGDIDGQGIGTFMVVQSTRAVSLKGIAISGAGIPISVSSGNPLIADCVLADNRFNALVISGSSRPVIRNCDISGARASAVIVEGQAQPVFEGNRFAGNEPFHVQNGSTYELDLSRNTFDPPASNMTILGNVSY